MKNLYRRMVTMGMISVTAVLAWVYCVLEFRSQIAYVIGISIVLIVAVYALLFTISDLRISREEKLQNYISETIAQAVAKITEKEQDNTDLERLVKASYVQLRKTNTILSQMSENNTLNYGQSLEVYSDLTSSMKDLVSTSVNKAVKVVVKYNQDNNDKLVDAIAGLNSNLDLLTAQLDSIKSEISTLKLKVETNEMTATNTQVTESVIPEIQEADISSQIPDDTNIEDTAIQDIAPINTDEQMAITQEIPENTSIAEETPDLTSFFDEFVGEEIVPDEHEVADVIPFPVPEEQPAEEEEAPMSATDFDPNRPMTPEEIEALFASMAGGSSQATEVPEPEPEPIPAPIVEEPVVPPVDSDPNRPLSPDEIAALFASMQ